MSMRWKVRGLPLENFNAEGGSVAEPFAAIQVGPNKDTTIILTKEPVFYEGDEERSSLPTVGPDQR